MTVSKNAIIIIGLTLIITILLGIFAIRPLAVNVGENYQNIQVAEQNIQKLEEKQNNLLELQKNRSQLEQYSLQSADLLPDQVSSGSFVVELEAITFMSNQILKTINIKELETIKNKDKKEEESKKTSSTSAKSVQFSSTQIGFFADFINLLKKLEVAKRFSTLDNLTLSLSESGLLETKIEGKMYYKPEVTLPAIVENLDLSSGNKNFLDELKKEAQTLLFPGDRTDPFTST